MGQPVITSQGNHVEETGRHCEAPIALQDTDELLAAPVLGQVARRAVAAIDPSLDPAETLLPVASLPGFKRLPSPLPIPDIRQRLYFRCGSWPALVDQLMLGCFLVALHDRLSRLACLFVRPFFHTVN